MKNALALVCCLMGTVSVADTHKATFGGGCFWCLEPPFESIHGVSAVVSGYAGGSTSHPTYAEVTAGHTGHIEVVEVTYDPRIVDYKPCSRPFGNRWIRPTLVDNLLIAVRSIGRSFLRTMRNRWHSRVSRSVGSSRQGCLMGRLLRKSFQRQLFTWPRIIIRTTTKPMLCNINFIDTGRAEISFLIGHGRSSQDSDYLMERIEREHLSKTRY